MKDEERIGRWTDDLAMDFSKLVTTEGTFATRSRGRSSVRDILESDENETDLQNR